MVYPFSYRITQYFQYNEDGYLIDDGWTSYSDIGKTITLDKYLESEEKYIDTIMLICKTLNIGYLQVSKLWDGFNKSTLKNKDLISLSELPEVIRKILREDIWCKLVHKKCQLHFGYDLYMYCVSMVDIYEPLCNGSLLHIEKYKSPYHRKNNL